MAVYTEEEFKEEIVIVAEQDVEIKVIPRKRVVKKLAKGMELRGTVRQVTNFGAFVDIGVGTDGLVHISELAPFRVSKVEDAIKEGEQVTVWIKELDKEANRISLTMIRPGSKTIRDLHVNDVITGTVTRIVPYGAFVSIGIGSLEALLHIREMSEGFVKKPEDVVTLGETLEVKVLKIEPWRNRVDLTLKGLRPEPESAVAVSEPERKSERGPRSSRKKEKAASNAEETWKEESLPTPFEFAMEKAQRTLRLKERKRRKKRWDDYMDDDEDDIVSRTLRQHKKK